MNIEHQRIINRFLSYTRFDTQSDSSSTACPSTPGQLVLARALAEELTSLGLHDVCLDANGYLTATLPANGCQEAPTVGFIAHLDTSPDLSGKDVKARIVRYEGGDIRLNEELALVLSPQDFPELKQYLGQDLIVTDGTTLLGADDKGGIAAIVSAVEHLLQHPERKHGTIRLCFTPDEEIGRGADRFDVTSFAADFAYTVDGGELGSIEYENFNAANATVTFQGRNVHPGSAKHKMRNALTLAAELQALLPAGERPEYTEGYEGFYHVNQLNGSVEEATLQLLIRDHDRARFEQRKAFLAKAVALLNEKYGADSALLRCKDGYYNMREKIEPVFYVVDLACQAMQSLGIETHTTPIRGGTDGARLSFMNLPCPNLFTGGHNFHGKHEFLPVESLLKASATVAEIICRAAALKK